MLNACEKEADGATHQMPRFNLAMGALLGSSNLEGIFYVIFLKIYHTNDFNEEKIYEIF